MKKMMLLVSLTALSACTVTEETAPDAALASVSFDGADYGADEARKLAHGERVAELLACNSCHGPDYSGVNFGEMIPLIEGLWATNISRTLPDFSDEQLETLLREGTHPARDIYLMPSRSSQYLSDADMDALIAHLRTIAPTGEPTPIPPEGFEDAVAARLPDEYWRVKEYGRKFYPNAEEEADFYAKYRAPALGAEVERGRYIAAATCASCHGPGMDGYGEGSGSTDGVVEWSDDEVVRLFNEGTGKDGQVLRNEWGLGHPGANLTAAEQADVIAYIRKLAAHRASEEEDAI